MITDTARIVADLASTYEASYAIGRAKLVGDCPTAAALAATEKFVPRKVPQIGETGYERIANDAYFTIEPWVTESLIRNVILTDGVIWEPACGAGHMDKVLRAAGLLTFASDLIDHGYGVPGADFLKQKKLPRGCRHIVTNPPYDQAEAFVRHALALTRPEMGRVAMLMRHEFDCAGGRQSLFDAPPFAMRLTLTRRPRWIAGSKTSPRFSFAWFVWDWMSQSAAAVRYDQ